MGNREGEVLLDESWNKSMRERDSDKCNESVVLRAVLGG
jgi:hypothetical protein